MVESSDFLGVDSMIAWTLAREGVVQAQWSGRRPSSSSLSVRRGDVERRESSAWTWERRAAV